uniref:Universal stress protein n=1 Tax=Muribaculaceae bacterium Z82 TaxID=2304548 RepID=A0A7C9JR48_9BACT
MAQRYRTVFAALDGTSAQKAVAQRAVAVAANNRASLVFGHVVDSVPYEASGVNFEALCSDCKRRIEEELAGVFNEARNNPNIPAVDFRVAAGRITETLASQLIEPASPDLIVCGERGLSNIKYAFVGSVSTFLIRTMDCDVLVVKQR